MYQIRTWLYTAGYTTASDARWLQHQGVQSVLSLHKPLPHQQLKTLHLPLTEGYLSHETIVKGATFIREQAQARRTILTTCVNGTGLSVTFAIIGLKEVEQLSLREAFIAVRRHNQHAMPDHLHWEALRRYYGEGDLFWDVWQDIIEDEHKPNAAYA